MIVWPGLRRLFGMRGGIPIANTIAHFDAYSGITSSGGFASAWADQSGNGRSLLQATGANQPIHLPFVGTKYGWLPGVAGNTFSTTVKYVTGDFSHTFDIDLPDYTPAALITLYDTRTANTGYSLHINTAGTIWIFLGDGAGYSAATSTVSTGLTSGRHTLKYIWTDGVGASFEVDGVALGDPVPLVKTIAASAANPVIGTFDGKVYSSIVASGAGTQIFNFDPSRWTSGTTFTASTGETWTINSTGSKPAQIVDRPSLLFDGAAHFMKTAAFTLNQPETVYLVAKQVTWTDTDRVFDGDSANTMLLQQITATPNLRLYAGSSGGENSNATIGASKVITALFNGASSVLQINAGTPTTGNVGAGNAGGFALGAAPTAAAFSNIQVYEALIYSVAHDAATRANVIRALMSKHGVA